MRIQLAPLAAAAVLAPTVCAGPSLTILYEDSVGTPDEVFYEIRCASPDGSVLGGLQYPLSIGEWSPFLLRADGTELALAVPPGIGSWSGGDLTAISGDGRYAVGFINETGLRWDTSTGEAILIDGFGPDPIYTVVNTIDGEGEWVVGDSQAEGIDYEPRSFLWTEATGTINLGRLPDESDTGSSARAINKPSQTIYGEYYDEFGQPHPYRWTPAQGMSVIDLGMEHRSVSVRGSSADGRILVGGFTGPPVPGEEPLRSPYLWTEAGGIVLLGAPTGFAGGQHAVATGVSGDGSVIVGEPSFIWTEESGSVGLAEYMELYLGIFPDADWRYLISGISDDGRLITGTVWDPSNTQAQLPFILDITPPCAADVTDDGALNFFDIVAFLDLFMAMDPAADLDGSGNFNFVDIARYINFYNLGCP